MCLRTSQKKLMIFALNSSGTYKVKRLTIVLPVDKGGLNMIDFPIVDKSLKAAWVKCFYEVDGSKWCSVFASVTAQYGGRFIFECNYDTRDLNLTSCVPSFYRDILTVSQELRSMNPSTTVEYLHETIWNNRFIQCFTRHGIEKG